MGSFRRRDTQRDARISKKEESKNGRSRLQKQEKILASLAFTQSRREVPFTTKPEKSTTHKSTCFISPFHFSDIENNIHSFIFQTFFSTCSFELSTHSYVHRGK